MISNHCKVMKATPQHDCYHAGFRWIVIENQLTVIIGCFTCESNAKMFAAAWEINNYGSRESRTWLEKHIDRF